MAENSKRVLVITTGRELPDEIGPSMTGRGYELVIVPTLKYAADRITSGEFAAVLVDFGQVPAADREGFLKLHEQNPKTHLFLLETQVSSSPSTPGPLRRLTWPFPKGFADQARVTARPIVVLADQVLYSTGAVQNAFQQSGVQAVSLDTPQDLANLMAQLNQAKNASSKTQKSKGFLGIFGSDDEPKQEEPAGPSSNVLVVRFTGTQQDAALLDAGMRAETPEAVCYFLSGEELLLYAIQSLKDNLPVSLPRDQAGRVAGILSESTGAAADVLLKEREREHVLLLDVLKPAVQQLAQALQGAGYDVVETTDGTEALNQCVKGAFHIAVLGASVTAGQLTGAELAQKMRERDPDLRIIFLVDQYPLKAALQGVSQLVELGLDDAILKPVEASRLIFSVKKALEQRFLKLENQRLLKETQEQKAQLELVNGFQKKFFATVAHDVKSPLTAILGYAEILSMKLKNSAGELRYASNIHAAAKTLNILISDLVDLAAIESGKLRVEIATLNLMNVIQDVRDRVAIVAQKRNINFGAELPPSIPPIAGDDARVGQVIQNLCTNAIQYTKEGGNVTIKAELQADRVVVSVIDTGIGISKEDLPRVWERFFQTKEAQGMRKAGFGLGLKIAREIVQRHGGEMGIESELGKGSRFFFHIPLNPPPAGAAAAPAAQAAPKPAAAPKPFQPADLPPLPGLPQLPGLPPLPAKTPPPAPGHPLPPGQTTPPAPGQPLPPGQTTPPAPGRLPPSGPAAPPTPRRQGPPLPPSPRKT